VEELESGWRENPKTRFMREPRTEASRIGEKRPPFATPRKRVGHPESRTGEGECFEGDIGLLTIVVITTIMGVI